VDELVELSQTGLVEIDRGGSDEVTIAEFGEVERAFTDSVIRALDLLLHPAGRPHPLLTRNTRLALRDIRVQGELDGANFANANRVELAARLITDIPSFPTASVDEIVDIRERVEPHLKRFRAAVADLESTLETDVLAEDFSAAVEELKLQQVDPAIEELHESLSEEGLGKKAVRATPTMATSVLALGAAVAVGAPDIAGAAAVAAGASTASAKEYLDISQREAGRKKNRFFLLFDVDRALKSSDRGR
jgi:hypothetical protein